MALPAAIHLVTVTFGTALTMFGEEVAMRVTVTPTHDLLWTATGQPILGFAKTFVVPAGMPGSFVVPAVDQIGWKNSAGDNFTGWAYSVEINYTGPGGTRTVKKPIQVYEGQTTIDLDAIPGGVITVPVSAPTAVVTSVNGLTGAVTVSGGGGGGGVPDDASVSTAKIIDNAVTNAKMADNAIGTAELADGAVTTAELGAKAVTTAKIADGAVQALQLAADSVTAAKILATDASAIRTKLGVQAAGAYLVAADAQSITDTAINALITGAPTALNTLDELAAALGDDANFAATVATSLGTKVPTTRQISGLPLSADITAVALVNALNAIGFSIAFMIKVNSTTHVWPTVSVPAGFTGEVIFNSDFDPLAPVPPSGPDNYYWRKYNA